MLKRICTFGLLSVAALVIAPAAHAQSLQTNQQNANQNAAAVGAYSTVDQTQTLDSYQDASGYPYTSYPSTGYPSTSYPSTSYPSGQVQHSVQNGVQNGAAVGAYSTVDQDQDIYNTQSVYDPSGYFSGTPQTQLSHQQGVQSGAAVGTGSTVYQDQDLYNTQDASNYGGFYPF